ncbi:T9SS type A sorting domain-containing protein [Neolewinella aurantiaca]|uniref:T9SS type A sorting domain-containing protein n=1 Tax=Neolewinella aurantiaca TaxID=2602767 RepID=A0A5C7FHU4_9BACT|nr:T9SS type A sorting domain-containing protein [Neolewinella aurantiaca]TXF90705.1 T9SS type A sorting domain-containing protein [Neolewinella aurantiaca]
MFRLLLLCLITSPLSAQIMVDCGETFHDPGGAAANYSAYDFQSYEICPTSGSAGDVVTITFTEIDFAPGAGIDVYIGGDFMGPIPSVNGQTIRSTAADGCIAIDFYEFDGNSAPGFTATVSCGPGNDCIQPTTLFRESRTASTATIDWEENGTASVWDVAVRASGAAFDEVPTTTGAAKPYTATGLVTGQTYDFYVRANCGNGELSVWTGPFRFSPLPPAPDNDECLQATVVPVAADDNCAGSVAGTLTSATPSAAVVSDCGPNGQADVWYAFSPSGSSVFVSVATSGGGEGGGRPPEVEIFSGACGGLVSIACGNESRLTGLTSGDTYYIRVYEAPGEEIDFNVCVYAQPEPPTNDECSSPTLLTPSATSICSGLTSATTAGATNTLSGCGLMEAGPADDDVWFTFTATSPTQLLYLENIVPDAGFDDDMGYEVLSGACGSLTSVICNTFFSYDNTPISLSGLTTGAPYLLRIYTDNPAYTVAFDICLATPPVNDDCGGALTLPVNNNGLCTSVLAQTTQGATRSGPDCGTARADNDLWYTFTATHTTHLLQALNVDNPNSNFFPNLYYELSEGTDCGTRMVIECVILTNTVRKELTDLTIGGTYFLRIFTRFSSDIAEFDLCLSSPPNNDDCDGAYPAAVNPDLSNTIITSGSTQGATMSLADPASFCSTSASDDDVWFSFTALAETHLVNLLNVAIAFNTYDTDTDAIVRLYGGDCSAPTGIACDFIDSDTDEAVFENLTPGARYFLTVESLSFDNELSFDLSIRTDPLLLPIQLLSFSGQAMDKYNQLEWRTASEENTAWHILQRSNDGVSDWYEVARTQAAGYSNEEQRYQIVDPAPPVVSFYRLVSKDYDGSTQQSGLLRLEQQISAEAGVLTAFPNPAGSTLNLSVTPTQAGTLNISIFDLTGRVVAETNQAVSHDEISLAVDLTGLEPGAFLIAVTDAGGMRQTTRIVKQ